MDVPGGHNQVWQSLEFRQSKKSDSPCKTRHDSQQSFCFLCLRLNCSAFRQTTGVVRQPEPQPGSSTARKRAFPLRQAPDSLFGSFASGEGPSRTAIPALRPPSHLRSVTRVNDRNRLRAFRRVSPAGVHPFSGLSPPTKDPTKANLGPTTIPSQSESNSQEYS